METNINRNKVDQWVLFSFENNQKVLHFSTIFLCCFLVLTFLLGILISWINLNLRLIVYPLVITSILSSGIQFSILLRQGWLERWSGSEDVGCGDKERHGLSVEVSVKSHGSCGWTCMKDWKYNRRCGSRTSLWVERFWISRNMTSWEGINDIIFIIGRSFRGVLKGGRSKVLHSSTRISRRTSQILWTLTRKWEI